MQISGLEKEEYSIEYNDENIMIEINEKVHYNMYNIYNIYNSHIIYILL